MANSILSKLIKPVFISAISLALCLASVKNATSETITVGVPYLPEKIDLLNTKEPLHIILLANLGTPLLKAPGTKNSFSATKITQKHLTEVEQVWDLQFPAGAPISRELSFNYNVLKDSIELLQELSAKNQELKTSESEKRAMLGKPLENSDTNHGDSNKYSGNNFKNKSASWASPIDLVKKIELVESGDYSFTTRFHISNPDIDFIKAFGRTPILIDARASEIFGLEQLGKNTNIPLFGPFRMFEYRSNEHAILKPAYDFGYPGEHSQIETLVFKVYEDQVAAMRALRAGTASMIILPSEYQIEDTARDATLRILDVPAFSINNQTPHKSAWNDTSSISQEKSRIDVSKIIIRRSIQLSPQFIHSFEFKDLSREN
ncbi:MAG TPA: hypothetical protein PKA63_06525 [Oligoflexia bacterium]|nr:hypothetical protein [Oligoflexia bacterium]HMP48304.1 hypothetical protein [Oligoflexia bacterium]